MKVLKSLLAGAVLATGLSASAAVAETTIFYGHAGPARGTIPTALEWFNNRIGELSGGDMKLDIQFGGALFKANASANAIGFGVADAGSIISAYFQKEMAAYSIADLPISGPNVWVGLKATDKLMRNTPEITKHLADKNLVYIGTFTASDVNVACTGGEISSVKDIADKRIRGAGVYGKVFGQMGATMVNLSVYEAYQALNNGLIDCSQGYTYIIPALKWHEVIDSFTVLNWGQIGGFGMFMNKQSFDALSEEQQSIMLQTGEELADEFAQIVMSRNAKALEAMKAGEFERDIKVLELSVEDRAAMNAATQPFIEEWKENANSVGFDADKLMAAYTEAVADYTKEFEEKGYPWERN